MAARKKRPAVVVPLDGSKTAVCAFGAAQAVTRLLGGVLHVVHITSQPVPEEELPAMLGISAIDVEDFVLHQIPGHVVNSILEFAMRIEGRMIVLSSHGWTHDTDLVAGSVAMEVIENSNIPVLVIRPDMQTLPDAGWRPQRMLVPLDGSPLTGGEVDEVFGLGRTMGVDIDILYVAVVGHEPPMEVGAYSIPRYLDYPHYDWPAWAEEFIRRFGTQQHREHVRLFHQAGDIVEVALRFAGENEDDLIALIWHGRLGTRRAGAVQGILQDTESPVLLQRMKAAY